MKKVLLLVLTIALTCNTFAQEKRKEVSINFSSLNSFGLSYKTGTSKSLWRYHLLSSNIGVSSNDNIETSSELINETLYETTNYGFAIKAGKEFRNTLTKNLEFRYGLDIGFAYSHNDYEAERLNSEDISYTYDVKNQRDYFTPSINGVIGFNYLFNKNLALGIEVLPTIFYRIGKHEIITSDDNKVNYDYSSFNFNLNTNSAQLSLAYRF